MFDKVLIVVGKTMSGKTHFVKNYLVPKGYNQVITHTTRPKRITESDNSYFFENEINQSGLALRCAISETRNMWILQGQMGARADIRKHF